MTTQRYHRCGHCGDEYLYTGSGHGCLEPYNHATWCPSCAKVVADAIAQVPRLFEGRSRDIKELSHLAGITLDQMLDWERRQQLEEETAAQGIIRARRVFSPLFDVETGDSTSTREVRGREDFTAYKFRVSTWRQKPEYTITVEQEYDLKNQCFTGHDWPHYISRRPR